MEGNKITGRLRWKGKDGREQGNREVEMEGNKVKGRYRDGREQGQSWLEKDGKLQGYWEVKNEEKGWDVTRLLGGKE